MTTWVLMALMLEAGAAASGGSAPHARATVAVPPSPTIGQEPSVGELCAAAAAVIFSEPARARSLLSRARRAGWLPELRIRVDRRYDRNESLDFGRAVVDTPAPPVALGTSDNVRYEGRATWDLSRIIFNPDEVGAHAEALRMADARREICGIIIRLYFERRRLKAEPVPTDATDKASQVRRNFRILEIEAELDALTDGAFSRPPKP